VANDGDRRDGLQILMRTPFLRFAFAVALLGLYYQTLLGTVTPAAAPARPPVVETATLRDIEASEVAYSAGEYAEALEATERLTRKFPSQAMYFDRLARIQRELGRHREEARAWEGVFRSSPTPVDACPMLAVSYERIPDLAGALNAYERCAQAAPDDPDLLLFLGQAYGAAERGEAARQVLERALAIAPEYPDVHLLLGVRNFADGDVITARARFDTFLTLAPTRREEVTVWLERTRGTPP
jgi:tetratricopeptide (TPR) repeat protein